MTSNSEEKRRMQEAMDFLRKSNLPEAENAFREFVKAFPQSDLADNACYNLAKIYLKRDEKQKALDWLEFLLKTYPNSDAAYMARDEKEEILRMLGRGPKESPDEIYQKGKDALAMGNGDEAKKIFADFLEKFPESDLVDNVHYNLALVFKSEGHPDLLRHHIEIILKEYPDSDAAIYAADLLEDEE